MASNNGMFIPRRMHRNPGFRKLNTSSICVLFEFLYRRKVTQVPTKEGRGKEWVISNNGEIVLTYAEIRKKFGFARSTIRNSIDQLVQLGFIDIAHHGGGLLKDCSKYAISDRWEKYGYKEFIKKSRPKDTRGLGITEDNYWERIGSKRKNIKSKKGTSNDTNSSITNDTSDNQILLTPSITNATHKTDPNYYIQKGLEVFKAMYPAQYHERYHSIDYHIPLNLHRN
tara:strand:- start:566 stop:1246 length:681 start_codon:yes stop_codon:yes gene_type:complete